MLNVAKIVVGALDTNCYVVWTEFLDAVIIDPGADSKAISKIITHCRLKVRGYLITHGHIDHLGALVSLRRHVEISTAEFPQTEAPIAMHESDIEWAFDPASRMLPYSAVPPRPASIERVLRGGEKFDDEGLVYRVISTPGHTSGGVCFYFPDDNVIFSGDTLFQGSVGRTDLPGGNDVQLKKSLEILTALPPETRVYPGHGPETTIGREIESNPFLAGD